MPFVALLQNSRNLWIHGTSGVAAFNPDGQSGSLDARPSWQTPTPPRPGSWALLAALWIARPSVEARVMFPQEQKPLSGLEVPSAARHSPSGRPSPLLARLQPQMMHSSGIPNVNPKRKQWPRTTQPGEDLAGSCIASNMRHAAQPKTPGASVHWLGSP